MIQRLLSGYRSRIGVHIESNTRRLNQAARWANYRYYGDRAMCLLLFGWLIFQSYTYHLMADRPIELFAPVNWFQKLFFFQFPHWSVWYSIVALMAYANFRILLNGDRKIERYILAFTVLWINCIRWNYEFFSHVGHVMVLYYLLGMFLPRKAAVQKDELINYGRAIQWLFAGILVGYSLSGFWKIGGLIYKMIWHPEQINWLHPMAMKINSIVGYRDWDQPLGVLQDVYSVPLFWQIALVGMMILQFVSVYAAVKRPLIPYVAGSIILFHLGTSLLIHIEFYLTPMVIFALFFAHYLVPKKDRKFSVEKYESQGSRGTYKRIYADGSCDIYSGFYALREAKVDKNELLWGWLYLPGISLLMKPFF